jgi:hypothetical protein
VSGGRGECIARPGQLRLVGSRVSHVSINVDGHRVKRTNFKILQRRALVLTRLPAPGRYNISAHVTFQLGSGTPSVIVSRTVTVCAPPRACGNRASPADCAKPSGVRRNAAAQLEVDDVEALAKSQGRA